MKKMVLIVDDEALILYGMSKSLDSDFIGVKTVTTGRDAIFEISSLFYDLCFLDMDLPDSNGVDIMKRIKEVSPKTRVVIMTEKPLDDDTKNAIERNAYCFIAKPFDLFQVKAIVRQMLEESGHLSGDDKSCDEASGRRQFERRPYMKTIDYSIFVYEFGDIKMLNLTADTIDISDGGIGILTDYPLEPGHVLKFKGKVGYDAGIVKWGIKDENRFGVQFASV